MCARDCYEEKLRVEGSIERSMVLKQYAVVVLVCGKRVISGRRGDFGSPASNVVSWLCEAHKLFKVVTTVGQN